MMRVRASRETLALLPWIAAAIIWLGIVSPMRAGEATRLSEQSRIRRDRVKAERGLREIQASRARVAGALGKACRISGDPAALRQRAVAASSGLPLSPFALTVTGGPGGGAMVDASGPRSAVLELLRRLGDPARGGFLRGAFLREKGGGFALSATTGAFEGSSGGTLAAPPPCAGVADPPAPADDAPPPTSSARKPGPARPTATPVIPAEAPPTPAIEPPPPFALVAFLKSEGRVRVSIRVGNEIRVVSAGDTVDGWRCLAIDPDEGATFASPLNEKLVLKPASVSGGR